MTAHRVDSSFHSANSQSSDLVSQSFHDPAARERSKPWTRWPFLARWTSPPCRGALHDLNLPPEFLLSPGPSCSRIPLIEPDVCQAGERLTGPSKDTRDACPILDVGSVHTCHEHQTGGLSQQVALSPAQPLGTVIATNTCGRQWRVISVATSPISSSRHVIRAHSLE